MNKNIKLLLIIIICIALSILLWCIYKRFSKSNKTTTKTPSKLENIQFTNNDSVKNKIYESIKRNYAHKEISDNPKLQENFKQIAECIVNKIGNDSKDLHLLEDNFKHFYDSIYKKDSTVFMCFNNKQLKAIEILINRISEPDIESIITFVKNNINSEFSRCENENCLNDEEIKIISNYSK